jgi:hypothetical protein
MTPKPTSAVAKLGLFEQVSRFLALCFLSFSTLTAVSGEPPPQFPRVRGDYQMTREWRVTLPDEYAKRFEKGELGTDLVLWRSGITCWITIYNQKVGETPATALEWRKGNKPKDAVQEFEVRDSKPLRYGYLLHETPKDDKERWALYTFTFGESGRVLMAIYFDRQSDIETAKKICFSITETPTPKESNAK